MIRLTKFGTAPDSRCLVKANSLELGLAGDQVGPGTGPDFLAKHKSGSIDFVEF